MLLYRCKCKIERIKLGIQILICRDAGGSAWGAFFPGKAPHAHPAKSQFMQKQTECLLCLFLSLLKSVLFGEESLLKSRIAFTDVAV